jgi:Rieske 2Fe-2S family protein
MITNPEVSTLRSTWLMPSEAYTSAQWYDREQRDLFGRTWVFVASIEELAQPGDFVTTTIGNEPVVVVRDKQGALRAFSNVCPHRGITLLEGCGNTAKGVVCPYHHWNFALNGELRSVPQPEQFPELDKEAFGLYPLPLAEWGASVFVNLSEGPEPFEDWMGAFPASLGAHDPSRLVEVAHRQRVVESNWKFLVENTIEVYHLFYLHRTTQDQYQNHLFDNWFDGWHWSSYTPLYPERSFNEEESNIEWDAVTLPPWLGDREKGGIYVHLIFPNMVLFITSRVFRIMTLIPEGPHRCRIDLRTRAMPGTDPSLFDDEVNETFEEDVMACERMQRGVRSSRFAVRTLAKDHERPIGIFQSKLLAAMAAE